MSNKYKWNEDTYDLVFRTCVALTNIHVKFNPLRDSDQSFYKSLQNYLVNTGDNISRKRARSQELYRDRVRGWRWSLMTCLNMIVCRVDHAPDLIHQ